MYMAISIILFVILEAVVLWSARKAYEQSKPRNRNADATSVLTAGTGANLVVCIFWKFFLCVGVLGASIYGAWWLAMRWIGKTAKVD